MEPDAKPAKRRGRPKGRSGGTGDGVMYEPLSADAIRKARESADESGEFPPAFINGVPNPDHYRAQLEFANKTQLQSLREGRPTQWHKQTVDGIIAAAEYAGIDRRVLLDARSDVDKVADLVRDLKDGTRSIMEIAEPELAAAERLFDAADASVSHYLSTRNEEDRMRWAELGKAWGSLFRRLRELRRRATTEIPNPAKWSDPEKDKTNISQAIAWPLRFMVYVLRSNQPDLQKKGGAASMLAIEPHHGKMAVATYCGRHRCEVIDFKVVDWPYRGSLVVIPPGHGKTSFALGLVGQAMAENPNIRVLTGHAVYDQAVKNVEYLKLMFTPTNPMGRRLAALYPNVQADTKRDYGKGSMRLRTNEAIRQPTIEAHGMNAAIQSADADLIWMDDPVDPSEAYEETTRTRKHSIITGGWLSRLRAVNAWHLTTTTLWHHDDANSRRVREAKAGKAPVKVLILGCGGPDHVPRFKPVSSVLCPATMLAKIYRENPAMYAIVYQSNPSPDERRIIRALRYYDPDSETHQEFLKTALFHLSLDPSATAREESDKAGIVYAAAGHVVGEVSEDGEGKVRKVEKRCRIISAAAIHATQHDLVKHAAEFCADRRVDYVHVEVVSGYYGTSELFKNLFDINPIEHKPGNRSKEVRLRGVAALIDDSYRAKTGCGACVEFPGKPYQNSAGEYEVGPDPEYDWLYRQFLQFGSISDDHCLDATTQLLADLQNNGSLSPGQGYVSEMVRKAVASGFGTSRMAEEFRKIGKRDEPGTVDEQDDEFLRSRSGSWNMSAERSLLWA